MKQPIYFYAAVLIWLFSGQGAAIADINAERLSQDISDTVMSPFCPGRTLSACPSGQAVQLRENITDWVESGDSEAVVRERLYQMYGDEITGAPQVAGFGILAWITPGIFVLLGVLLIRAVLRRGAKASAASQGTSQAAPSESDVEEIEREVQRRLSQ